MWSDWMAPFFTKTSHDKSLQTTFKIGANDPGNGLPRIFNGHPTTRKLRVVCKGCNNNWMSRLESAVKPTLAPMISGNSVTLDEAAQATLTRWIVLKLMVWDHLDQSVAVFTRDQNLAFSSSDTAIPDNLKIWLLCAKGPNYANISRAFSALFPMSSFAAGEISDAMKEKPNTQTVLLSVGKLLVFAVHSHLPGFEAQLGEFRQTLAKPLWPPVKPRLAWPPIQRLSPADRQYLSLTLHRYLQRPGMTPL